MSLASISIAGHPAGPQQDAERPVEGDHPAALLQAQPPGPSCQELTNTFNGFTLTS